MAITADQDILAEDFINESERDATPANDEGRVPKLESDGYLDPDFVRATSAPITRVYTTLPVSIGDSTTQFDITNPAGNTFRYTFDGTGTNPNLSAANNPIGSGIYFNAQNFNANNNGKFIVTGSGANYVEVTNASGVAESNKTIGTGRVAKLQGWEKPAGLKYIDIEMVGGGGGSAYVNSDASGGGGGSAYVKHRVLASSLGSYEVIYIGAGGPGGTNAGGGSGTVGYSTSFGNLAIAIGGSGGVYTSSSGAGGGSASSSTGDVKINGGNGGDGQNTGTSVRHGGIGGSSYFGGEGAYGSGGKGASVNGSAVADGNAGQQGICIVTEYYN